MVANHIAEIDLFALMQPKLKESQNPNDVHFKESGYELMGAQIASVVSREINGPAPKTSENK